MTEPDFAAILADSEQLKSEQAANRPKRAVECAFVHDDGTIMTTAYCGEDEAPPDGLMMIEGEYDQNTQRFDTAGVARVRTSGLLPPDAYPVVDQTEMDLIVNTPSVAADSTEIASITNVPVRSRFYMSEEEKATPVNDGEVTLTFDTPGIYTFTFVHQGYLDTVVTIEATDPASSP